MGLFFGGGELRLEQGGYEEAVGRRFDGADFAVGAARYYGEASFHGGPFVLGVDFEVAEELFGYDFFVLAVERLQVGAGAKADFGHLAGELWRIAFDASDGAGYRVDHDVLRSGVILGAVGVGDAED